MTRTAFAAALALLLLGTVPALAATARSSGAQSLLAGPGSGYGVVGRLANQQRVDVIRCSFGQRWCEVTPVGGGPTGWVLGSYLIGSAAKNGVSPPEFSFDPMDPGGLFGWMRRR